MLFGTHVNETSLFFILLRHIKRPFNEIEATDYLILVLYILWWLLFPILIVYF